MLTTKPKKTIENLMNLPPETRAELIEGEIFMSPAPNTLHQVVVCNILRHLDAFARERKLGKVFISPLDVVLSHEEVVQPDVIYVAAERARIVTRQGIQGVPDLHVEVVSPGSEVRDRVVKRKLYADRGVREYWIVEPEARTVEVLNLKGGRYELHAVFEAADSVTSPLLKGLSLPVAALFE